MRNTIPTPGIISWGRRVKPAVIALGLLLAVGFTHKAAAQLAPAGDPNLTFGANYFVTGDYVVAGAQGLNASFGNDGLGTGIISFPDGNQGIRGTTTVPKGANIVAAILYWQTVEKVGALGSGQNGSFGPVIGGTPRLYPLSGLPLLGHDAVSFSDGGCSGTSTGKVVRTYRADVRQYLPADPATGNVLVDSADGVTFEVRLPNVGKNTPFTLGASLVLVFRVINSPNFPLNAITIYEGPFAPNTTPNFTMSQLVQGFYQAANSPVSKLTHIVGAGKSNKFQHALLGGGQGANHQRAATALPSPYGDGQPAFPGHYVNWDNTTWVFPDPTFPNHPNLPNPLQENDDSATAMVVASGGNPGCVSWGATIVGTTVHDDEKDGILQVWKQNQGYTDVPTGLFVSLADPADPINTGHPRQDIFIQMDHVVDSNGDFGADASTAASTVQAAFLAHNVHLHFTDALQTTGIAHANEIQEPALADGSPGCLGGLCPYPNQIGITTWRDGFEFVKNQPLNLNYTEAQCEANTPPLVPISNTNCIRRFPLQQRFSHHYVIWGDTLGGPNWTFFGGRLTDSTGTAGPGAGVVQQTGANTVTFYTTRGHGLTPDPNNNHVPNGRVTVANAITNPSLNGTHLVTGVNCPVNPDTIPPTGLGDCSVSNRALGPYIFTISVAGNMGAQYTVQTDPYLSVTSGQAGAGSGFSDVGGAGTLITLFQWGDQATPQAKAGTFMHELGHTLGLLHGGGDNTNCKSNYQSVMNYMFQAHLLGLNPDFSSQQLSTLDENSPGNITTTTPPIAFTTTKWYDAPTLDFKVATITSLAINSNVVTFQAANTFTAGNTVLITGLTSANGTALNGQVLTVFSSGLSSTQFKASFAHVGDVGSTADTGTATTTVKVPVGDVAAHHCDGTSLTTNDPAMSKYAGGTATPPMIFSELDIPWSSTALANGVDANFEGGKPGSESKFFGYNDWANADYRQVGAGGNEYFSIPGAQIPGGPGGQIPGGPGAQIPGGPGGQVPGGPGGQIPGGPGGQIPGGPGAQIPGGPGIIGNDGKGDLDFGTAVDTIDPPTQLTASEGVSPRTITLNWNTVTFPLIGKYNIYRSADQGATFSFLKSVAGPPAQDMVACNPSGYQYFVTAVFTNTAQITSFSITSNVVTFQAKNSFAAGDKVQITGLGIGTYLNGPVLTVSAASNTQFSANFMHSNVGSTADSGTAVNTKESAASNTVSTGQNGQPLTGCYAPTGFLLSSPANAVHGSIDSVTFTVQDASNTKNVPVNTTDNPALVTFVANGPLPGNCGTVGDTTIVANGMLTAQSGASTFPASSGGNYTLNLDTDVLCAGQYTLKLILDNQVALSSHQMATTPLQLSIDVNDTDTTPHVATLALTAGTVGLAYNNTLTQHGGTAPFTWTFTGSLPTGISQPTPFSPTLTGTTCVAGAYNFTAMVTDSKSNSGTQPLTLQINKANTTTGVTSSANPSVFQQTVTFTVTVAPFPPENTCTPTGTVTLFDGVNAIALKPLTGGMATFMTSALSVGIRQITASYSGDSNFNGSNSNSAPLLQTVNKANTATTITSVLPSPAVVGQAITVAYTLPVVPPGAGTPIGPTGTVTVAASDNSGCVVPATLGAGACVLMPAPTTAGRRTFTVTYSGDSNFVGSSDTSGTYTVLIFVSDTAPPPFTPATTLPNAVVGSPYSNTVYESGGLTGGPSQFSWALANGSNPLPAGISLGLAPDAISGLLSGIPTAAGTFNFTVQVTDSQGNTGTQTVTLSVADALFGDLIVVDGSPSANPPSGTLFRITPDGTVKAPIANISNGSPTGVAVDPSTGNILVAVALGTPRIVEVTRLGVVSDFVPGGVLTNPVAVAVDKLGNVYVGDNNKDKIYKFNSAGMQVDANGAPTGNPFASLPSSPNSLQDIRMAFDSAGNLIVATDAVGDVSGVIEVDQINPAGTVTVLYNTTTNSNLMPAITFVGGIAVLADGSIDVADLKAQAIFKITNPGAANMGITTLIGQTPALCCSISGMANSPSQQPNTTDLYITLNGVGGPGAELQLAVPETGSVTNVVSGAPLTFPNDVASYSSPGVTFYIDGNSNFGILNLGNGATKVVGVGTVLGTGIDVTPTGQVYVDDFFNHLYQMNTSTGAATLVGTGSIPAGDFYSTGGLTNGSYFAVDASSGNLYSINLSTGATTLVGLTGTATIPSGCAVETTMAGSATVLYYSIGFHSGRNTCSSPMPDTLYAINPATGATTTIGPVSVNGFGVNSFPGSGYVNGRLYAFTGDGKEYIIDTVTGAATFVTNTTPAVFGAGSTNASLSF